MIREVYEVYQYGLYDLSLTVSVAERLLPIYYNPVLHEISVSPDFVRGIPSLKEKEFPKSLSYAQQFYRFGMHHIQAASHRYFKKCEAEGNKTHMVVQTGVSEIDMCWEDDTCIVKAHTYRILNSLLTGHFTMRAIQARRSDINVMLAEYVRTCESLRQDLLIAQVLVNLVGIKVAEEAYFFGCVKRMYNALKIHIPAEYFGFVEMMFEDDENWCPEYAREVLLILGAESDTSD